MLGIILRKLGRHNTLKAALLLSTLLLLLGVGILVLN